MGARPSSFTLTRPGKLRLYSTTELLTLPDPTWLIKDILPAGGLVGVYGEPGHGKTFVTMDMAMHVATGRPWLGHQTNHGLVLYVAAEGGTGIKKRAYAWLHDKQVLPRDAKVAWLIEAILMNGDPDDLDTLFARLNDEIEDKPALIIVDTLARCFEGDENMQEDMGRFIAGVDRLRREFGSTVIVVHHTRLDAGRERGSTAFRGAADTMIYIKKERGTGDIEIACNKQKDAEEFAAILVQLKVVPERDSCVISEGRIESTSQVLQIVLEAGSEGVALRDVRKRLTGSTMSLATTKRKLMSLVKSEQIVRENNIYYPGPVMVGSPK